MQDAAALLAHIKEHAARGGTGPAVPKRVASRSLAPTVVSIVSLRHGCAAQLLLRTTRALAAKDANLTELRMNTGRLVIVSSFPCPHAPSNALHNPPQASRRDLRWATRMVS